MNKIILFFKKIYRVLRNHLFYFKNSKKYSIKIFNYQWDKEFYVPNHWLYKYIDSLNIFTSNNPLFIYSVNGERISLRLNLSKNKLFYTFENVHVVQSPWIKYKDLLLNKKSVKLSIGFDYIEQANYIRFPYWIVATFDPIENKKTIAHKCYLFEQNKINSRDKFCAFICRYDYFGDRTKFADLIETIAEINYPGNFRKNDTSLKLEFKDDKINYLSQFKFNLCPENSNHKGYVTEKIFDAIKAGCIPIYWGSENNPEPEILNQNRIIFLKLNEDNSDVLKKIKYLNDNEKAYNEFIAQKIFNEKAVDSIFEFYEKFESKLKEHYATK